MSWLAGHSFKCCQDYHWSTDESFVKWWRTALTQGSGRATSAGGKQRGLGIRDILPGSILGARSYLACCDCSVPIPEGVQSCNYQYNAQASSPQPTLPLWVWLVGFWLTQSLRVQQVLQLIQISRCAAILSKALLFLCQWSLFPTIADFKAGLQLSRCRGDHTGAMRKQGVGKLLLA